MKLNLVSINFNWEVETTLIYIWIQLLTAVSLLSINYDDNIILSWMKNSMQNAKQNFSMNILVP